jgi:hypothetical protein
MIKPFIPFNVPEAGGRIASDSGVHAGHVVEYFYRHRSTKLLIPALQDLAPHNGPTTNSFGPLMFFLAAVLRRQSEDELLAFVAALLKEPCATLATLSTLVRDALFQCNTPPSRALLSALEGDGQIVATASRGGLHDVRAYGARGPSSINCLWADFYATGEREALLLLIQALPSWHDFARAIRARGQDPDHVLVEGAGRSARWSLAAHALRHERVRGICAAESMSLAQPHKAREELIQALAEVDFDLEKASGGRHGQESALSAWASARGAALEPAEPPEMSALSPQKTSDAPVDLSWLDEHPFDQWLARLADSYPTFESIEAAIGAIEAALLEAPPTERARLHRDAGLLAGAVRYFGIGSQHLSAARRAASNSERALELARLEAEMALHARRLRAATEAYGAAIELHEEQHRGALTRDSQEEDDRIEMLAARMNLTRQLKDPAAHMSALDSLSAMYEQRLSRRSDVSDIHSLAVTILESAMTTPDLHAKIPRYHRGIELLQRALQEGAEDARHDLGMAHLYYAMDLTRAGEHAASLKEFDNAIGLLEQNGAAGDITSLGGALEAQMQRALTLAKMGHQAQASEDSKRLLARLRDVVATEAGRGLISVLRAAEALLREHADKADASRE